MLFEKLSESGHEEVVFCHNPDAGLKAIIAIHNTILGPALGGLRMWPYPTEQEALDDVLRLSRTMTLKAAVAGLNLGGGKCVIIGDPASDKSEALFRCLGRFIESLNGRYITAEDVGIDVNDMEYVFQETDNVVGVHQVHGGSGDPAPFTAYGTIQGIRASLRHRFDNENLADYSYAVQGAGHVGFELVRQLRAKEARVFVTDIQPESVARCVDELGAQAVALDEIYDVDADVFCPCALGGIVNADTIPRFGFKIICGSANNQLADDEAGNELNRRGILYAPDFAVNAGGLMNVSIEFEGYNRERAKRMMRTIYENVGAILEMARRDGISTWLAANQLAEQRIAAIGKIKLPFLGHRPHRFPGRKRAT